MEYNYFVNKSHYTMDIDKDGWINSYYGRWNIKDAKPKLGVVYFMLDIHVKKIIEKERIKFIDEISELINTANKNIKKMLEDNSKKFEKIFHSIKDIKKFEEVMNKTIELNQLKKPDESETLKKPRKKKE